MQQHALFEVNDLGDFLTKLSPTIDHFHILTKLHIHFRNLFYRLQFTIANRYKYGLFITFRLISHDPPQLSQMASYFLTTVYSITATIKRT
jgi:hypothetical protein